MDEMVLTVIEGLQAVARLQAPTPLPAVVAVPTAGVPAENSTKIIKLSLTMLVRQSELGLASNQVLDLNTAASNRPVSNKENKTPARRPTTVRSNNIQGRYSVYSEWIKNHL